MLAGMNWRAGLTIVLLIAAIASGWSIWSQSGGTAEMTGPTRSDYVLYDYEIVSLDSQGKESFTLHGPRLQGFFLGWAIRRHSCIDSQPPLLYCIKNRHTLQF